MALALSLHRPGVLASALRAVLPPTGTPKDIFTNIPGTSGYYYDPGVLGSMWQDAAKTIPVTADGQPVGAMDDLSGNNRHLIQETAARRTILRIPNSATSLDPRPYLEFRNNNKTLYAADVANTTLPFRTSTQYDAFTYLAAGAQPEMYIRTHRQWSAVFDASGNLNIPRTAARAARYQAVVAGTSGNLDMGAYAATKPYTLYEGKILPSGNFGWLDGVSMPVAPSGAAIPNPYTTTGRFVLGGIANQTGLVDGYSVDMNYYGGVYAGRDIDAGEVTTVRNWFKKPASLVDLFPTGAGVTGAYHDPRQKSSLFQDSAMTVPVVNDGDPVGAIMDLSGNGNHLIQATAGLRPIYRSGSGKRPYLEFRGGKLLRTAASATYAINPGTVVNLMAAHDAAANQTFWCIYNGVQPFILQSRTPLFETAVSINIGGADQYQNAGAPGVPGPIAWGAVEFRLTKTPSPDVVQLKDGVARAPGGTNVGNPGNITTATGFLAVGGYTVTAGTQTPTVMSFDWYGGLVCGKELSAAERTQVAAWYAPTISYRVRVTAVNGDTFVNIADLQFRKVAGVEDTGHYRASASSQYSADYSPDKAFDGSNTLGVQPPAGTLSYWSSTSGVANQWLQSDCYGAATAVEMALRIEHPLGGPRDFVVERYNGTSWDLVKSFTAQTWSQRQQRIYSLL